MTQFEAWKASHNKPSDMTQEQALQEIYPHCTDCPAKMPCALASISYYCEQIFKKWGDNDAAEM